MKYCTHCGKELLDEAVVCPGCGCAADQPTVSVPSTQLYRELSEKVKINSIIWICVAALQLLGALCFNWVLGIVGVLNLISGIRDLSFSKELLAEPKGIAARFESLTGPVITLIYNLIFGGIIGVAGSIYYLVGIRSFVLNNKEQFA